MESREATSPRIFAPSSLQIDDSQLCFSKTHFTRPDFDVQRFMNLARRRANLDLIQKDLRLYLKSIQHSMIELINDDYADFVHLSSNLVGLRSSIEKIDKDLGTIWTDFETSTKESVSLAEKVEHRCEQLTSNRSSQRILRDRIAFLSALQRLQSLVESGSEPSTIWLENVASHVVDISIYIANRQYANTDEDEYSKKILGKLEKIVCNEGVKSASSDCVTFPLVLSILSLMKSTDALTAMLVAQYLQPKLVSDIDDNYKKLTSVFDGVKTARSKWSDLLGTKFSGSISLFLDQTLLSFIQTFLDKCLSTVVVPSDTRLFHKCYLATLEFIQSWPSAQDCRNLLKGIREKFNLVVYYKLESNKFTKKVEAEIAPDTFSLVDNVSLTNETLVCKVSETVIEAIETIWSDDVYLAPLTDKLWDFTLRMLSRHLAWAKAMNQYISVESNSISDLDNWVALLYVVYDVTLVNNKVFDFALENIWTKLSDLNVDTSVFGQCLTRFGVMAETECSNINKSIEQQVMDVVNKELDGVLDVPKQYRWTKKPLPTIHSQYLVKASEVLNKLQKILEESEHKHSKAIQEAVLASSLEYFVKKATEVLDGVDATGSSLSRFKRRNMQEGATDDDKIKAQIHCDVKFCIELAENNGISIESLKSLLERSKMDSNEGSKSASDLSRNSPDITLPRDYVRKASKEEDILEVTMTEPMKMERNGVTSTREASA